MTIDGHESLAGRTAIVTGGGTGVGRETSLLLAQQGCQVVVNYSRSREEAEVTARDVEALGVRAIPVQADVADDRACRHMIERTANEFGGIDILINNAGTTDFIKHDDLDKAQAEVWHRLYAVNVIGPFQCIRAARPHLAAAGGQVVNIASTAGITAMGSSIPYCASKAALINMTQSLARALAPEIRVNAIAPGFITGRWLESGLGPAYPAVKEAVANRSPMKRVSDPIDIARAVMSLIMGSTQVTGQTLICDGGMMLGSSSL